jgi:alkylation response protein AidB-like acyl-CoA dehydrogenase
MANFFTDNEDLQFYFDKAIKWDKLIELVENNPDDNPYESPQEAVDTFKSIFEMFGQFVAEEIAPYAEEIDRQHPRLENGEVIIPERVEKIFAALKELDLHGMALPRELGGMNTPLLLYSLLIEVFSRADVSTMSHFSFHQGIALSLLFYSILEDTTEMDSETGVIKETRFKDAIAKLITGEEWGSMDLTEAHAGSDLAQLRTKAEQDDDGHWFITGTKIWITSGHGRYHIVIARSEDDPELGLDGLSLYLVEAFTRDEQGNKIRQSTLDRVDEKLGHHGSVTVAISFDKSPAQLIGKRGDGFKLMLMLMNNARISVGFESLGLCESAYRMAREFAAERPAMGKTIDKHEMIADMLDEMDVDILGLRALCVDTAYNEEIARRLDMQNRRGQGDETVQKVRAKEIRSRRKRSRMLTPLVKYFGSEKSVQIARRCMQIHGGSGYMTEYGAEKLLRDSLVLPIYEGTSQIQSLMATKDSLQFIFADFGRFMQRLSSTRLKASMGSDKRTRMTAKIRWRALSAQRHLITKIIANKGWALKDIPSGQRMAFLKDWDAKRDFAPALLHAERLTRILCDAAIAEVLFKQIKQFPERAAILDRFLERADARTQAMYYEILHTGERLLNDLHEGSQNPPDAANENDEAAA